SFPASISIIFKVIALVINFSRPAIFCSSNETVFAAGAAKIDALLTVINNAITHSKWSINGARPGSEYEDARNGGDKESCSDRWPMDLIPFLKPRQYSN